MAGLRIFFKMQYLLPFIVLLCDIFIKNIENI